MLQPRYSVRRGLVVDWQGLVTDLLADTQDVWLLWRWKLSVHDNGTLCRVGEREMVDYFSKLSGEAQEAIVACRHNDGSDGPKW